MTSNQDQTSETGPYRLAVGSGDNVIYPDRDRGPVDRPSVSAGKAATIAGVHPDTMRAYVDQGLIDGYRLPKGHRRVYLDSLARHIAARRRT